MVEVWRRGTLLQERQATLYQSTHSELCRCLSLYSPLCAHMGTPIGYHTDVRMGSICAERYGWRILYTRAAGAVMNKGSINGN